MQVRRSAGDLMLHLEILSGSLGAGKGKGKRTSGEKPAFAKENIIRSGR